MEWLVPIVVALIGGPIVILLQRSRKENATDHAAVFGILNQVFKQVNHIDEKLDSHLSWHKRKPREKGSK